MAKTGAGRIDRMLAHLALQKAGEGAQISADHGCRICCIPSGSWHAKVIRDNPDMPQAQSPSDLREALKDPSKPIVFLPSEAVVTREVIDRICAENPLNKMVIWETN